MAILVNGKKVAGLGAGVAKGGQTGQALVKKSNADYDTEWIDLRDEALQAQLIDHMENFDIHVTQEDRDSWFSGDYNDLANTPNILDDKTDLFQIADSEDNVILKVGENGLETTIIKAEQAIIGSLDVEPTVKNHVGNNNIHISKEERDLWTAKASVNYVDEKVAGIVGSSPELLNTLEELSAALGNDPNFSTTVLNSLSSKALKTEVESQVSIINNEIATINGKLTELMYEPLTFNTFTANGSNALNVELGTEINDVALKWTYNKTPITLKLNNTTLAPETLSYTDALNLKPDAVKTVTYTLTGTDEKDYTATKKATISFINRVYYGVLEQDATINSATILTMSNKLQNSRALSVTITPTATQHIAFAFPKRLGEPTFKMGGFETTCIKEEIKFTNNSGFTEDYNIYKTTHVGLGKTEVVVS